MYSQLRVEEASTSLAASTQEKSPAIRFRSWAPPAATWAKAAAPPRHTRWAGSYGERRDLWWSRCRGGAPLRVLPGPRPFVRLSRTNLRDALAVRDLERPGGPRLIVEVG